MYVHEWPLYFYRGAVSRVIDGDTAIVDLALGCRVATMRSIRLLGYDAPELFSGTDRERGAAAKDALETLIPVGSRVYIKTELDRTSFDRLLGHVLVEGNDGELVDISELMISGGFIARKETP